MIVENILLNKSPNSSEKTSKNTMPHLTLPYTQKLTISVYVPDNLEWTGEAPRQLKPGEYGIYFGLEESTLHSTRIDLSFIDRPYHSSISTNSTYFYWPLRLKKPRCPENVFLPVADINNYGFPNEETVLLIRKQKSTWADSVKHVKKYNPDNAFFFYSPEFNKGI